MTATQNKWHKCSEDSSDDVVIAAKSSQVVPPVAQCAMEQLEALNNLHNMVARARASQEQRAALQSSPNPLTSNVAEAVSAFESFTPSQNKSQ